MSKQVRFKSHDVRGYSDGGHSRARSRIGYSKQADSNVASPTKRSRLRESCRHLDRTNSVFQAILNRGQENVIGLGPQMTPQTLDSDWNAAAKAIYEEAGKRENYTRSGERNRRQVAQLLWRSKERDGGALIYHPKNGVQVFEEGQILTPRSQRNNPRVRDGIGYAQGGFLDRYFVGPYSKFGFVDDNKAVGLKAWHVDEELNVRLPLTTYIKNEQFISSLRGVPAMAAAIDHMERLDEYLEAILDRAVNEACVFGAKFSDDENPEDGVSADRDDDDGQSDAESNYDRVAFMESGVIWNFKKDDEFQLYHTTTPNTMIQSFVRLVTRLSSIARGQPTEISMLDFGDTNFSASRAAIEQAKLFFRLEQRAMGELFWVPDYHWCLYEAIKSGALPYREDWLQVKYDPAGWQYLDPKADAQAAALRLQSGEATLTKILSERGITLQQHLEEAGEEIVVAQRIADQKGVPVELILKHAFQTATGEKKEEKEDAK
jgi:capsid protein